MNSSPSPQPRPRIAPPMMIDQVGTLARLQQELRSITRLAVDTESNSLFAYHERVCLIQLSTDTKDYLVDPIKLDKHKLDFLGEIFANPHIEKVLHAAEYDVMTLRRDYGYTFTNLFDTMIAARILGLERVGLGPMLEDNFGLKVDKKHQRANWGRRPLTQDMIRYAQMDTHYLLQLRDLIYGQLKEQGHLEEARELFDEVAKAEWGGGIAFDPQGYWRINGVNRLQGRPLAVIEALYQFREKQAERRDMPVFKIMTDETVVQIGLANPTTLEQLAEVSGVGQAILDRYGTDILHLVHQAEHAPIPKRPDPREQLDEVIQRRYDALHLWRKERALKRGVSSEVIFSKDALWELAHRPPKTLDELQAIRSIGPWRAKTYGDELLAVLTSVAE